MNFFISLMSQKLFINISMILMYQYFQADYTV